MHNHSASRVGFWCGIIGLEFIPSFSRQCETSSTQACACFPLLETSMAWNHWILDGFEVRLLLNSPNLSVYSSFTALQIEMFNSPNLKKLSKTKEKNPKEAF